MKWDESKFVAKYETVYKDMYRFALCMMRNQHDAEDAVSVSVLAAYENIRSLKKEEAFKSWIFTILSNNCKRQLKKNAIESLKAVGIDDVEPTKTYDFDLPIDMRRAFDVLSDEEKDIIGLSVFGGYTSSEIGSHLKLNDNTVRSKRSRALQKMSYILEAKGE